MGKFQSDRQAATRRQGFRQRTAEIAERYAGTSLRPSRKSKTLVWRTTVCENNERDLRSGIIGHGDAADRTVAQFDRSGSVRPALRR
jgi:hypothetical protein